MFGKLLKQLFPSAYNRVARMGGRKVLATISVCCFAVFFGLLALVVSPSEDVGVTVAVATFLLLVFYLMVVAFVQLTGTGRQVINDMAEWPPVVHYFTIILTAILLVFGVSKLKQVYEQREG